MSIENTSLLCGASGYAAGMAATARACPGGDDGKTPCAPPNEDRLELSLKTWQERQEAMRLQKEKALRDSKPRFKPTRQPPKDVSGKLTARLVAASLPFQVRSVMSSASSSLTNLLAMAATCEGKDAQLARSYAGKLQKLIMRARGKIDRLNDEALRTADKKNAESKRQHRRAEEIKNELRQKRQKRAQREFAWLRQSGVSANGPALRDPRLPCDDTAQASEAQIAAYAEAVAAYEAAMGLAAGDMGTEAGTGGEAAAAGEGGEGSEA